MELFKYQSGADIQHIPFKGVSPVLQALIADAIQVSVLGAGAAKELVDTGKLVALALDYKSPLLPNVPDFKDAGFPDMHAPAWWAVAVPAQTPPQVVEQVGKDVARAVRDPRISGYLVEQGYKPIGDSPEETSKRIQDSIALWAPVVKAVGITMN
jgi:tripartite-type tricarboxylate transporter receptor subunit TctC